MSSRPLVVVTDFIAEPLQREREILGDAAEVVALNAVHEDELASVADRAVALLVYHGISLTERSLSQLKQCRLIVRCGVGIDNVDCEAARRFGIDVANVPDYGTEEVADSTMALTLSLTRGSHLLNVQLQRSPDPWSYQLAAPLQRLRNKVFAIVGLGRIGLATALRAKAHGFDVRFYDPYQPQGMDKAAGITRCDSLEELVREAFVLSLHCPLTPETELCIDEALLRKMPQGGFLVNTARGGLVDPRLVLQFLENEHLAGAALDVLPVEPPETNDPVIAAWRNPEHAAYSRLIINPHSAFYCEQGLDDMRTKGAHNCLRVLRGEAPVNVVNR
ncbi:C-terminal binding protein [Rubinisphaera brasiliensis]|uniref:Phosphoglycerate dehydrogenase n=1 Tax=Rubinisphaera brasiliensis (strain ATCC 49424 / DSM 5305 / JCM 21570 / IAM 15109 / NBRC 103401 / IFAM 1448) TaxID=756272 RepID=F0SHU9_RUBBR|nr:C-terminal binding protein [Rubinisphaera brasiliensis]ADY59579.1 Phosphoglycerate dehydrogenase [Rubinisphaera brasiliensis DSM 5305]